MVERLRIVSGALVAAWLVGCAGPGDRQPPSADAQARGSITGRVRYVGPRPAETQMFVPNLNRKIDAHTVHVDPETGGLRDAVVFLESDTSIAVETARIETQGEPPMVNQIDEVFVPHVLAVRAGRPVRFTSFDNGNHNIHAVSFEPANTFNRYFALDTVYHHTFQSSRKDQPVKLICDLHSWMQAWVYVFDHPYFAVTGPDGRFTLNDVPPGRYTLVAHHADEHLRHEQPLTIDDGKTQTVDLNMGRAGPTRVH